MRFTRVIHEKPWGSVQPPPLQVRGLTLAGPIVFLHTPRPRGEGVGATPFAVWPLIELELRGKKRAYRALRDAAIDT